MGHISRSTAPFRTGVVVARRGGLGLELQEGRLARAAALVGHGDEPHAHIAPSSLFLTWIESCSFLLRGEASKTVGPRQNTQKPKIQNKATVSESNSSLLATVVHVEYPDRVPRLRL
jgi:hypothetical protein